jgi:hypothetical protein
MYRLIIIFTFSHSRSSSSSRLRGQSRHCPPTQKLTILPLNIQVTSANEAVLKFKACQAILLLKSQSEYMPFCRKCGRRLAPYSKNCPECKTSTTGPVINIKKAATKSYKTSAPTKIAKAMVPKRDIIISITVIEPVKSAKPVATDKAVTSTNSVFPSFGSKPAAPTNVHPMHEIKQTNVSLKEDILTNPHDYETQTFGFNLQCSNNHFWPAYKAVPVSKGKAFCPKCGEPLKKPKQKKRQRPAGFNY